MLNVREVWRYRDLLLILGLRDVKLRYKQTALGITWVLLQPLLAALLFAVVFGRLGRFPSDGYPYWQFAFTGLVAWNFFSGILQRAGGSVVAESRLITKVYFPRVLVPFASALAVGVDFLISTAFLILVLAFTGEGISWRLLMLPALMLQATLAATGASLFIAAMNVRYRDFGYALPFFTQMWFFATPVAYSLSLVPASWQPFSALNPAVGFVDGFRWSLLGSGTLGATAVIVSTLSALALFAFGSAVFRRAERSFADII